MTTQAFPAVSQQRRDRAMSPILTPVSLAALEGMSTSTAYAWIRSGLVTSWTGRPRGWPTVPLVGLADAHLAQLMRKHRLPAEEIRGVITTIREAGPGQLATLSQQLVTDGIHAYLHRNEGVERVVGHQYAISSVLKEFSTPLIEDEEGFVVRYRVDRIPGVEIIPGINAGRMTFVDTGIPVFTIAGALVHSPPEVVAYEYDIPIDDVRAVAAVDSDWLSAVA